MRRISHCFLILFLMVGGAGCGSGETPAEGAGDSIDLIVKGAHIVTMDAAGTIVENGAVAIDEGVILAIGSAADIQAHYSAVETLDYATAHWLSGGLLIFSFLVLSAVYLMNQRGMRTGD